MLIWHSFKRSMLAEAKSKCSGKELDDFRKDLEKYHISYNEWKVLYDFPSLTDQGKEKFISRYDAQKIYRKFINRKIRSIFYDKVIFLKHFQSHIKRQYITPPVLKNRLAEDANFRAFVNKLTDFHKEFDIIVKPEEGSLGVGIYKIKKSEDINLEEFAKKCVTEKLFLEECLKGCDEIQRYNPGSLNTLRIVTAYDGKEIKVFNSFIRFGIGDSVVDNCHRGGAWCHVDIFKGEVDSNAVNTNGDEFDIHPVSQLRFAGLQIPKWEECCKTVCQMHEDFDLPFIGWDVCVTDKGNVEVIEGNHASDVDLTQYPIRKGIRKEFEDVIERFKKNLDSKEITKKFPYFRY